MAKKLNIGDKAPHFEILNSQGESVQLKSFQGKNVVLYFYPKDATPGCTKEACDFRDFSQDFESKNTVVLGISKDSIKSHEKFRTAQNLPFELLSDPDGKVCESYGVWQEKKNYGRTYMGIVRSTFLINPKGEIAQAWYNVRVPGHVEKVLESV